MTTPWRHYKTRDEAEMVLTGLGYEFARDLTPTLRLASGEHIDCYAPQHLWETEDGQQLLLTDSVINWIIAEPRKPLPYLAPYAPVAQPDRVRDS